MLLAAGMLLVMPLFAGGILTNTNQSAAYVRMLARNATLEIDGVYYNPAGLVFLEKGWHFSVNDQAAFQKRTITNSLSTLHLGTYTGDSKSFLIPSIHAVYRKGDFAFSLGLSVVGGGGTLTFDRGLPSFEAPISLLKRNVAAATGLTTTNYSVDQYLKGSSATYGGQLGVSYKINDMFSASLGGRIAYAQNSYNGYIKNIKINPVYPGNPTGALISAATFFTEIGQSGIAETLGDKVVNVEQTGLGFTPILGVNFSYEKLNVAARYEFQTNMNLKNNTSQDDTGMFPDGKETPADIPAILSLGASYDIIKTLKLSIGYNHFFNKNADMENGKQQYLKDGNEFLAGAEWNFSKLFLVSAGYQYSNSGITPDYQTDMAHSFVSHSVGGGGALKIGQKVRINIGYFLTKYIPNSKQITYATGMPWQETATETYKRSNHVVAIGIDFRF